MITGSCHCGTVRFEIEGTVREFDHCHCQTCRKIHGAAYGASALIDRDKLTVTSGADNLTDYLSSPVKIRHFCATCGGHVFATYTDGRNVAILRMGMIDPGHGLTPEAHIYVEDKPDWYEILDGLPQYDTLPADSEGQ